MVDFIIFEEICKFILGLIKYMFCEVWKYQLFFGCGVFEFGFRCKIDFKELDYFLNFIISFYIIQDLLFGEKFLKLFFGEVV